MINAFARIFAAIALFSVVLLLALLFEASSVFFASLLSRGKENVPRVPQTFGSLIKEEVLAWAFAPLPATAPFWLLRGVPWLGTICVLLGFLFLPIGVLPPLLGMEGDFHLAWSMLLLATLCLAVGVCYDVPLYGETPVISCTLYALLFETCLAVAIPVVSWYILKRGIPGDPFNIETFVGLPLWSVTGASGKVGLCALFFGMGAAAFAATDRGQRRLWKAPAAISWSNVTLKSGLFGLQSLLKTLFSCALLVCLFLPFSLGKYLQLTGMSVFATDFFFFWVKVFVVQALWLPLSAWVLICLRANRSEKTWWFAVMSVICLGSFLIACDFYFLES